MPEIEAKVAMVSALKTFTLGDLGQFFGITA
jgi:hypothetical protein